MNLIIPIKHLDDLSLSMSDLEQAPSSLVILVYDSASDECLRKFCSKKVIALESSYKGAAGMAIYEGILFSKADKIIVTMGDGCDSWEDISKMALALDHFDIVSTTRFNKRDDYKGGNYLKEIVTRLGALFLSVRWGWKLTDPTNNFKGYKRNLFDHLGRIESKGFSFGLEVLVKAHVRGYKITEIGSRWSDSATSYRWVKRISSYLPYLLYRNRKFIS